VNAQSIFDTLPPFFVDPVTKHPPANERELTALLSLFHQRRHAAWDQVTLYNCLGEPVEPASTLLGRPGVLLTEYPLFARANNEIAVWGCMLADLVFISSDSSTAALIENKIGSKFTSEGEHLEYGQLARQAEYLRLSKVSTPILILLSTIDCFRSQRYGQVLHETLLYNARHERVTGRTMFWHEIIAAVSVVV
jgi:hypothetical protein